MKRFFFTLLIFMVFIPLTKAASITISQAGADPGSVMKGIPFTVTVSGLSGSGTVYLNLPSGFSTDENNPKSFASGTSSVSWSVTANQKLSSQTITATITTVSSTYVTSDPFDVKLPPSLLLTYSPSSFSNPSNSHDIHLTIQNWGETTARDVVITLNLPSGTSLVSGQSSQVISEIEGGEGGTGESVGLSWTISFSNPSTSEIGISVVPSNGESKSVSIPVYVSAPSSQAPGGGGGGGGGAGGGGGGTTEIRETISLGSILAGYTQTAKFSKPEVLIQEISISVNSDVDNVVITVTREKTRPSEVTSSPEHRVYAYLTINVLNLPEENISGVNIKFRVNKTWIRENNIDFQTIRLLRYTAGSWEKLETQNIGQDSDFYYYKAQSSGLSVFAIVGEEVQKCTEGERKCEGNQSLECVNGKWVVKEICEFGCENGICKSKPVPVKKVCEDGKRKCEGNQILECVNGKWIVREECEFGCENGVCKKQTQPTKKVQPQTPSQWIIFLIIGIIGIVMIFVIGRKFLKK